MLEIAKKLENLKSKGYKEKKLEGKEYGNSKFTISTISSEEEMNCHLYAQQHEKMGYIYALKREILAYSIKEIDGVDLRKIKFIETEEKDGENNSIKIQKNIFIREILKTWNHEIINLMFVEYASLYNFTSNEIEKAVEFIGKQVGKVIENTDLEPNDIAHL